MIAAFIGPIAEVFKLPLVIAALLIPPRRGPARHATVRLLMTTPGVGPITAIAVIAAFDDAARFRRSSSAGAYLGLTPRRYEAGEII